MSRHIEKRTEPAEETLKRIEARVAGRNAAKEILPLLSWPDGHGADFAQSFCDTMRELLPRRHTKEDSPPAPIPIARLGQLQMVFGVHKGKHFDDIPLEYLDWLCCQQEDFYKSLRAYLKHPELESRRRGTGD